MENANNMTRLQKLTFSAMVMALYIVVLCLTSSFSFGAYQIRIATSLYALAYLFPFLVVPLGLANLLSNMLFGGFGVADMLGGFLVGVTTAACIVLIRRKNWNRMLIAVPIVLVPGLGVATYLSYILAIPYPLMALNLCVGQLIPSVAGVALVKLLERARRPSAAAEHGGSCGYLTRSDKMSGRTKEELKGVSLLGNRKVSYPDDYAPELLETFPNKHTENDYFVKFNCPEFTSLCPMTGQPDFATIYISYVPGERMVESKSLKLYLFSFRNHGDFHEDCVNVIMKDLIRLMEPKYIEVWGKFTPRGGISIDPYCNYGKKGTPWEKIAFERLAHHDMYPEKVDNR